MPQPILRLNRSSALYFSYPLPQFFLQRNFLNGWAGFIGSVIGGFYAFLRCAKLYEHYRFEEPWTSRLPKGAPIARVARDEAGRIIEPSD